MSDYAGNPVFVVKQKVGAGYVCFPRDNEVIEAFIEWKKSANFVPEPDYKNKSGAV